MVNDWDFAPTLAPAANSPYGVGVVGGGKYGGLPVTFGILDVRVNRSLTIVSAL